MYNPSFEMLKEMEQIAILYTIYGIIYSIISSRVYRPKGSVTFEYWVENYYPKIYQRIFVYWFFVGVFITLVCGDLTFRLGLNEEIKNIYLMCAGCTH
jgi:hypothetical protein